MLTIEVLECATVVGISGDGQTNLRFIARSHAAMTGDDPDRILPAELSGGQREEAMARIAVVRPCLEEDVP